MNIVNSINAFINDVEMFRQCMYFVPVDIYERFNHILTMCT